MRVAAAAAAAAAALLSTATADHGLPRDAPPVTGNPTGVVYKATLPDAPPFFPLSGFTGNVKGSIVAKAGPDGEGVKFSVRFENLPETDGPFHYHVHVDAVPADGNCTKTLGHLDPFHRGGPPCNTNAPETCEVGDLSGKHGPVPLSRTFSADYVDKYFSLSEGDSQFMGNRSFVLHLANNTRLTCANFVRVGADDGGSDSTTTTASASDSATTTASASNSATTTASASDSATTTASASNSATTTASARDSASTTASAGASSASASSSSPSGTITDGVGPTTTLVPIAAAPLSGMSLPLAAAAAAAAAALFFAL